MDIDKKPEESKSNGAEAAADAVTTTAPVTVEEKLKAVVALLEKSVKAKDTRLLIGRLLRQTASVRKQLTPANVKRFLQQLLPADLEALAFLSSSIDQVGAGMDQEGTGQCVQPSFGHVHVSRVTQMWGF